MQRSLPVWKEHASWFSATITEAFSDLPSSLPVTERKRGFLSSYDNRNLRYSVYRHVLVLESSFRKLFSFIPRQVFEGKAVACDPLPPLTSVNYYDQDFFRGAEDFYAQRRGSRQRTIHQRPLEQLLPDPVFRRQLQVLLIIFSVFLAKCLIMCIFFRTFSMHIHIWPSAFRAVLPNLLRWRPRCHLIYWTTC